VDGKKTIHTVFMAITKEKKEAIIAKLESGLSSAQSAVFVKFHGLSVGDTTAMRKDLRDNNVAYTVAKKSLIGRALESVKPKGDKPALEGEIALAYGDDLLAPAREVYAFQKKHKDGVTIVGGIFEGMYKSKEEMTEIAAIPAPEILRGQFVNVINSPIQGLVIALNQIAEAKEA
jgi:large subunit ribosomal protein L10